MTEEQLKELESNLKIIDRNIKSTLFMLKWALIPMWALLLGLWIWRLLK